MAVNNPSCRERIRRYKAITLWIGLVAMTILLSLLPLFITTDWSKNPFITGYPKITTKTISGKLTETTTEYPQGKTIWDLLQLLIFPALVGIGVTWLTFKLNEQQSQTEHNVSQDEQHESALQLYIDRMSELLLKEHLNEIASENISKSEHEEKVQIARIQTLMLLHKLNAINPEIDEINIIDANRKASVLNFLQEAGLINKDKRIIDLTGADLRGANLSRVRLSKVYSLQYNLSRTDLSWTLLDQANLCGTNLCGTNLHGTSMCGANLSRANLTGTDLRGANLTRTELYGADFSNATFSDKDKVDLKTDLHEAKYNTKVRQEKDEQGNPVTIQPTQWPQGFDPKAHGAICVDCKAP